MQIAVTIVAFALAFSVCGLAIAAETASPSGPGLRYYYPVAPADPPQVFDVDVCVYGDTPGGIAAAIQARRLGRTSALFCFGRHIGGMTAGGLSATDVGNAKAIGGMAREFYDRVGMMRGFRPSKARETFLAMLKEAGVPVHLEHRLAKVIKDGPRITEIAFENGNRARARIFVDATYEGDLLAGAGVSYHVGRESNDMYQETLNGKQFRNTHNFVVPVDPYKVEGDPSSGLLWGISDEAPGKAGEGDRHVQAYNFRMFLSSAEDRIPFPRPPGYDPARYALLVRYLARHPHVPFQLREGDSNNTGGFSTDYIGGSDAWPEADYATRERIFQDHVNYQQGLMFFAANDPSVPADLRQKVSRFGLAAGEFTATGGWPPQLYVREGRRMVSDYVMTEHNCLGKVVAEDGIGLASYNMDSHNCRRIVIDGKVRNEGDVQVKCPQPYPISYRSIVPREKQCTNLLVPVCLSSTHIAYGSIRMEPVFMILGQSAATAGVLALESNVPVQRVDYAKLKQRLVAMGQILQWNPSPLSP